jgi:hypothetical protein
MRGMDGQLWRVAANLQFFYDESGRVRVVVTMAGSVWLGIMMG